MDKITFIRDFSDLSSEAEDYLKELGKPYLTYYSNDEDLPCILGTTPFSSHRGKQGFAIFKALHPITIKQKRKLKLNKINSL